MGYAVVTETTIIEAKSLPTSYSAQTAELTAVIRACEVHEGQAINIFTDSQYVFGAVHHFAHYANVLRTKQMTHILQFADATAKNTAKSTSAHTTTAYHLEAIFY